MMRKKTPDPKPMTIGTLAKEAGVGVETIRFYEKKGLIPRPKRIDGGFRHYPFEEAQKIRFVKRAQELGFTLKEIKDFIEMEKFPQATCGDFKERALIKMKEVEAKIKDLERMKKTLTRLVKTCGTKNMSPQECRIQSCFEAEWNC